MMSARVSALLACLALGAAVPAVPADTCRVEGHPTCTVLGLLAAIPELSTFVRALKAANLTDGPGGDGDCPLCCSSFEASRGNCTKFTIFAPTNDAFGQLPPGRLEGLLDPSNIDELRAVLTYHVVDPDPAGSPLGPIFAKDLKEGEVKTMEGESVDIRLASASSILRPIGAIFVDRARVVKADLVASDGVIHTVSGVLEPLGLNHLYFRYLTGEYNCGQVDAGPRMPASIFDKENAMALQSYIDATLAFAWEAFTVHRLELGTCSGKGFSDNDGVPGIRPLLNIPCVDIKDGPFLPDNRTIDWAPAKLMQPICVEHCDCNYLGQPGTICKDVPDNPLAASWCSLCGPKFNKPIEVQCFKTEEH